MKSFILWNPWGSATGIDEESSNRKTMSAQISHPWLAIDTKVGAHV